MSHLSITRRRFLQSAAVSAVGMTAYGKDAGASPATAGDADEPVQPELTGTVRVADPSYLQPSYEIAMDAVTAALVAAHPGLSVEQVAPPFAQYRGAVETQLQAGSPPDVIRIDDPQLAAYVGREWLLPVDDVLDAAGHTVDGMAPAQRDALVDGQVYGVVKESNPRAYIYNQDLYTQFGVDVPTDLASFEEVLRNTTDASSGQFGIGIASKEGDPTGLFIQLMPFVLGFGGGFFDGSEPTASSPQNIEALEFVKMLWDDGIVPRGLDAVSVNNLMAQAKIATMISGAFIIGLALESDPEIGAALTTAPNPLPSDTTMRATAWWGVPADAENPEGGKAYIQTLLQPDVQTEFQAATAVLPATREGVSSEFLAENPWFETIVEIGFGDQSVSYFPQAIGPQGADAMNVIGDAILEILYVDRDVTEAMQAVQNDLEELVG